MRSLKIFAWWFVTGATMALAVIMLQGGLWEVFQSQESPWEDKLINMVTAIFGGGLLAGCIALIMTRIKKQ